MPFVLLTKSNYIVCIVNIIKLLIIKCITYLGEHHMRSKNKIVVIAYNKTLLHIHTHS